MVVAVMYALERAWGFRFESSSRITYDRIDLVPPGRREELLADLRDRTGLPITRVEIGRLDFLRDTAQIKAYYDASAGSVALDSLNDLDYDTFEDN